MKINRLCLLGLNFLLQIPLFAEKAKVAVLDAVIHNYIITSAAAKGFTAIHYFRMIFL